MSQNPYQTLGVSPKASADEIRKAFRKLAKANHPDVNPNDKAAEERFKKASSAFDILGDKDKREKFDRGEIDAEGRPSAYAGFGGFAEGAANRTSRTRTKQGFAGMGGNAFGDHFSHQTGFSGMNFEDVLSDILKGRGENYDDLSSKTRGRSSSTKPKKGEDLRLRLEISLEDSISGCQKRISLPEGETLNLTIPKGSKDSQVLRLRGKGHKGNPPGDALVTLSIKPHPIFRFENDTLHMDLPVSVPDAILGAKIDASTPNGLVSLTIPAGSNSGQILRLKGRGGIDSTGERGDLLARIIITLPDKPDAYLENIAKDWREHHPYRPQKKV